MRQRGRGDDRRIGDVHAVMHFVFLFQAAQDGDGVFDRRLVDQHLLETAFEGGILFDVLAVFVQGGGANAVQIAARQRRFQHVAGVHRALGLAGADHGMQFVDEQDDAAFLFGQILEDGFQPLLELAAEFGAGDERTHVERQQAFALHSFRHFAVDDALRESFRDGGLAHAGFADQHRIVLGAPLQDLDHAPDLVIAPDDRIELALLGALGQVDGVFLQRLTAFLGVRVFHLLPAAHGVDGFLDAIFGDARFLEQASELALVLQGGEQKEFARNILIAALLRVLVSEIEQRRQIVGDMHLAAGAFHRRQAVERLGELRAQGIDVHVGLGEQAAGRAAFLVEQRRHQVRRFDELVVAPERQALRVGERLLKLGGHFVHAHGSIVLNSSDSC